MAKITKKKSINIKGILEVSKDDGEVFVSVEDGDEYSLGDLLKDFSNCEVAISVTESVDFA